MPSLNGLFDPSRRITLEDGRILVVQYQGERFGPWGAYIVHGSKDVTQGATPAEAIVNHLELPPGEIPSWIQDLSKDHEREFRESPRFVCDCCGYRTLLRKSQYEICDVCGWEDDHGIDLDTDSGPNRITLRQGRENFARFGASDERSREWVRDPRPEEIVD